jgi:hypothetical protein
MKNYLLGIAVVTLVAGCASNLTTKDGNESPGMKEEGIRPLSRAWFIRYNPFVAALARPNHLYPMVYVDDSKVIVDQEPVHVRVNEGHAQPVKIEWTIGDDGYFFPGNGVVITVESGPPPIPNPPDCFPQGQTPYKTFICRYKRPDGKARYSYTITVTDGTNTYTSDPYIAND